MIPHVLRLEISIKWMGIQEGLDNIFPNKNIRINFSADSPEKLNYQRKYTYFNFGEGSIEALYSESEKSWVSFISEVFYHAEEPIVFSVELAGCRLVLSQRDIAGYRETAHVFFDFPLEMLMEYFGGLAKKRCHLRGIKQFPKGIESCLNRYGFVYEPMFDYYEANGRAEEELVNSKMPDFSSEEKINVESILYSGAAHSHFFENKYSRIFLAFDFPKAKSHKPIYVKDRNY